MIKWQRPDIGEEEIQAVNEVLKSDILTNGPKCREFEKALSKTTGAKYVAVVNSGTAALLCALRALQLYINQPDRPLHVLVPTFSYIATANSVGANHALLELADSERRTWNMSLNKLNPLADVVMPVDIGGLPCDFDAIPKEYFVLEDASEAIGASYKGKPCGSISDITTFSFHESKTVTTGEGGAIATSNSELYDIVIQLRSQGNSRDKTFWEYKHDLIGFNYRMTEMQAAVGIIQLKKLNTFLGIRKDLVKLYKEILGDLCNYQTVPKGAVHSNWLFGILLKNPELREQLCEHLLSKGIEVRTTWKPIHQQVPYRRYSLVKRFPVAEKIASSIVSLPLTNKTTQEEARTVAEEVRNFIRRHS